MVSASCTCCWERDALVSMYAAQARWGAVHSQELLRHAECRVLNFSALQCYSMTVFAK